MQEVMYHLLQEDDDELIAYVCSKVAFVTSLIQQIEASKLDQENLASIQLVGKISSGTNPLNIDILLKHGLLNALNQLLHE